MSRSGTISEGVRITWAIVAKDITDALKNRTILGNLVVVLLMMVAYKWMPTVLIDPADSYLLVYDQGSSSLATALEEDNRHNVLRVSTRQEFERLINDQDVLSPALVIPSDFEHTLDAGGQPEIEGYVMWPNRVDAEDAKADLERQIAEIVNYNVDIQVGEPLHYGPDDMGPIRMVSVTMVIVIFFTATLTLPHLMVDEKQNKTLDALLVSPASIAQVVVGKALAGLFYCCAAAAVALAFNWTYITSWGMAVLATLAGSVFGVAVALLMGAISNSRQQMMIWVFVVGNIFLVPVFLNAMEPILPDGLRSALPWMPTVANVILFRYACSVGATVGQVLTQLGVLLVGSGVLLALAVWRVKLPGNRE
jgi:ABC-2 type transport system permease protein